MKQIFFLLLSIPLFGTTGLGQVKKEKGPPPTAPNTDDHKCIYQPKYSTTKRLQFHPFNVSDTIKLVSYRYHGENLPVKKDSIVYDSLIEVKVLKPQDINNLTDILYNNFYKKYGGYEVESLCWSPRNAILFIDRAGKLMDAVIICFHCNEYEVVSNRKRVLGDECDEKIEKLRKFFAVQGIQFGTKKDDVELYPGETDGTEEVPQTLDNK